MSQASPPPADAPLILIVEDSATQSLLLRQILEKHAFRVVAAGHGEAALAVLLECEPALVITDIQMPVMDGWELCRRLKHDPARREIPVMLLTSFSSAQDVIHGLACGADNFVAKPYEEGVLLRRIATVLANRRLPQPAGEGAGITIEFGGCRYVIEAAPRQILSLLLSTYETAVETNQNLVRAHEHLRAAQAELIRAEKMRTVGRLAAGVAHEVRNPLAILEMGLSFLATLAPEDEGAVVVAEMQEALRRADAVITSLMEISSPAELGMREGDLHAVLERALTVTVDECGLKGVRVERRFGARQPRLRMDEARLEQVFINLITNACHAMPEGGTLSVETENRAARAEEAVFEAGGRAGQQWREGDQLLAIEIGDTGGGIAAEHMDKIFDPFFSTKPTGKGMGLGLTVARKLVEMHGGTIAVFSKPQGGTLVRLLFKVA